MCVRVCVCVCVCVCACVCVWEVCVGGGGGGGGRGEGKWVGVCVGGVRGEGGGGGGCLRAADVLLGSMWQREGGWGGSSARSRGTRVVAQHPRIRATPILSSDKKIHLVMLDMYCACLH